MLLNIQNGFEEPAKTLEHAKTSESFVFFNVCCCRTVCESALSLQPPSITCSNISKSKFKQKHGQDINKIVTVIKAFTVACCRKLHKHSSKSSKSKSHRIACTKTFLQHYCTDKRISKAEPGIFETLRNLFPLPWPFPEGKFKN